MLTRPTTVPPGLRAIQESIAVDGGSGIEALDGGP
jgi:hypothetical protein